MWAKMRDFRSLNVRANGACRRRLNERRTLQLVELQEKLSRLQRHSRPSPFAGEGFFVWQ